MPVRPDATTRSYASAVRAQRAADTRRRIAAAAQELFAEHGFGGTTVTGIATRAGVAAPTVYATFGSKGEIVRALLAGMEQDAAGARWLRRVAAETDPRRKLAAFAGWSTALYSSSKATIQAAQDAAGHPAIRELQAEGDRHRRAGLRALIGTLARGHALQTGLTERRAVDRAWLLTGIEIYLNATERCGWSDRSYRKWLAATLHQQLLDT